MRKDLEKGRTSTIYNYLSDTRQGDPFTEPNSITAAGIKTINAFRLLVLLTVW